MDEPLGALDAFTRQNLQEEIVKLFINKQKTVIFVTHDVDEAILLGQQVVILEKGSVKKQIAIKKLIEFMEYTSNSLNKCYCIYFLLLF